MAEFIRDREIEFLLYEFLDTEAVTARPRYEGQDRVAYGEILRTARALAERYMLPFYRKGDEEEVTMIDGQVRSIPEVKESWQAVCEGFMDMTADMDDGGLQLPETVARAVQFYFQCANISFAVYPFLTQGVVNLIRSFGTDAQKAQWIPQLTGGTASGTMALTEPAQGSALADITTRAEPQEDGSWRIFGQKIYISTGDTDASDNVVHMVLAKTKGAGAGAKGISLFLTPKWLPDSDGEAERNDVHLSGVLHKMGQRSSPTTVLTFGEKDGAKGWLVGEEGAGLSCMFQMMNEARIGVGIISAALAYRGFLYSLDYAQQRPQGRLPSNKNPKSPQVMLTEHADVRRLLLLQKAWSEGAMAMCLYAAALFEDQYTAPDEEDRTKAAILLDLLTPAVKSWSAKYGCISNEQAIQILGGAGYTRDHPVEQFYRDQRINPIHEGAEAIHGLDILGRKARMRDGAAIRAFADEVNATLAQAEHAGEQIKDMVAILQPRLSRLLSVTDELVAAQEQDLDRALANATLYLDVFGRVTAAWLWMRQALIAEAADPATPEDRDYYAGKLAAARFYVEWELPGVDHMLDLLEAQNPLPFEADAATL
ncbi:acyl-CoA dehydrogenase [Sulfitobacter porphyrae]|uniref:Acyl-CoA dehydrogenase n=1 Tax=Sulfitobacter porphyrae TaxID=1246864 RepID=A0ABW2B7B5_9RHOB